MNDNKKLVFNTVILYIKLIFSIFISFVTSRLILDALGASDYGLYNVVGGFVALLNILATSMIATSYRYIAVEIGRGKDGNVNKVYNTIFVIHIFIAFLFLLLGETLGLYYVNNYLNIEPGKLSDARFIFHLSLLTSAFAVITIPANGLIIAKERFLFTSFIEIVTSLLKLLFVISLLFLGGNKLRLYAFFLAVVQLLTPLIYQIYNIKNNKEDIAWNFNYCFADYKEIFAFAFWMLLGASAVLGKTQGSVIIINYFFGTILNAAFGLATQVSNGCTMFTSTLRQAAVPQIMKGQASGDNDRTISLVYIISRFSFFFMLIPTLPFLFRTQDILRLWLKEPPNYTDLFVIFMIIDGLITSLGSGFDAIIQSTGKVRINQVGYAIINLLLLPIMFVLYKLGYPPYINVVLMVILSVITLFFQTYIMVKLTSFNVRTYFEKTILPSIKTIIFAIIPLYLLNFILGDSIIEILSFILIAILWTLAVIYFGGVNKSEKQILNNIVKSKFH